MKLKSPKKLLSIILCFTIMLSNITVFFVTTGAAETGYNGKPVLPQQIDENNYWIYGFTDDNWEEYDGFYGIRTAAELYGFSNIINVINNTANAVLLSDITVNTGEVTESGDSHGSTYHWTPIGKSVSVPFGGVFDGNGHTISGLYCIKAEVSDAEGVAGEGGAGLFGWIGNPQTYEGAEIKNVILANSYFSSCGLMGGIAACSLGYGSTISNCKVSDDVTLNIASRVTVREIGGIIGSYGGLFSDLLSRYNISCTVTNCVNLGKIYAPESDFESEDELSLGAIVGQYNDDGNAYEFIVVNNCFYTKGCIYDSKGNTFDFGRGGIDRQNNYNCTVLSSISDSHTCVSVEHKEIKATCQYSGLSNYSFCLICEEVTNGSAITQPVIPHSYSEANCYYPATCTYCGETTGGTKHSWTYYTYDSENAIVATCSINNCSGGSIKMIADDTRFINAPIEATVNNNLTNGATYTITYDDGDETAPKNVGTHTATLTVFENGEEKQSVTAEYTISYLPAPSEPFVIYHHTYTDGEVYWFKSGSSVTVGGPDGYLISSDLSELFSQYVEFSENESKIVWLKCFSTFETTDAIDLNSMIRYDTTAPAVTIELEDGSTWNSLLNNIAFDWFLKGSKNVVIKASDEDSGIAKTEYFVASEEISDFDAIQWQEYTGTINLDVNTKNIVYARATDNVGNYIVVCSNGMVLYTDSTLNTDNKTEIVYVKTKNAGQSFNVNLNGNTVKYVKIDDAVLETDYYDVFSNGMIILNGELLESYAAGNYTVTVGFNPLGETFTESANNHVPNEVSIPLVIKKAEVGIEISDFSKIYDALPVEPIYTISKSSDGSPAASSVDYNEKVEFKIWGADDSSYTTDVPVSAGKYTVRITVEETDLISSAIVTADFEISKKEVVLDGVEAAQGKDYDGTTHAEITSFGILLNAIQGDEVAVDPSNAIAVYSNKNVGNDIEITFSGFALMGKDAENYILVSQPQSTLGDIYKKAVSVTVDAPNLYYGETSSPDISAINLIFNGIAEGDEVGYTIDSAICYAHTVTNSAPITIGFLINGADADNYQFTGISNYIAPMYYAEATIAVLKAENSWTAEPCIDSWEYGDEPSKPFGEAKYGAVNITYRGTALDGTVWSSETAPQLAGSYMAIFTVDETDNYGGLVKQVEFTIDKPYMLGDINDNGIIDSMDYVLLKRAYFGTYKLKEIAVGDINKNGSIDSMDYVYLRRAYFGTYNLNAN